MTRLQKNVGAAIGLVVNAMVTVALVRVLQAASGAAIQVDTPSAPASNTAEPDYLATNAALKTQYANVTPIRQTGIFEAGPDLWEQGYRMRNAWQRPVNGHWAWVLAGSHIDNPAQGIVYSVWEIPNGGFATFYNTPSRAGSVQIIAEQDARLTLEAEDGTLFYFDVPSQSFVGSLTEVAPTITPPPTYTPEPPTATPWPAVTPAPLPPGYPGIATGYPPAFTPPPTMPPAALTAAVVTADAWQTKNAVALTAQALEPTPGPALGPQTVRDKSRLFELTVPSGWRAYVSHSNMTIRNYDDNALTDVHQFPPGGMMVRIQVGRLSRNESFEEWQADWITLESAPNEMQPNGQTIVGPEATVLGRYAGSAFYLMRDRVRHTYEIDLPLPGNRVMIIHVGPPDSPAFDEAMAILATLVVLQD